MKALRLTAVSLLWLALAGCVMVPKLEAPRLSVSRIQLGPTANTSQQPVVVTLHVINPNDRAIAVRSIDAQLEVENMAFAQGETAGEFTLPPKGETDFDLNVVANLDSAMVVLASRLGRHTVDYRIYGNVHLKGSLLRKIPFDQKGRVKF